MSIFDAATEDQRRKRNQKKLPSVLQNMVLTSESVEQYECIWDGDMSGVTRTRNVYDSPSIDGSPVSRKIGSSANQVIRILTRVAFQDGKDNLPSTGNKRRGRRAVISSPGPRRQTRASTRAASSKVGKRGSVVPKQVSLKIEEGLDSDDATSNSLRAPSRCVFDGDADAEADTISMEDDVFQERRQPGQGLFLSPYLLFSCVTALLTCNICRYRCTPYYKPSVRPSNRHAGPANQHASECDVLHLQQERFKLLRWFRNEGK